ncbi:transposase [Mycobacteroides abscessus subsp. massiliense]|nr:transposase [Mycobacteroides abscessus subsp. massiliense]SKH92869.1 transposase [Mycobacteroides abscessus subsp. massiliense]SKI13249.1 transposase [Mycobacteroides abscessus subsp. massiliense]SKJ98981.1 transposase [Mycobacteroides abscessus subsp. massiliense]SKK28448.1 transposase [Mycobacteroides abscessus subsp. massiliense]
MNPATSGSESESTSEFASAEWEAIAVLVRSVRANGSASTGPEGLLKLITKRGLERCLMRGMAERIGHEKNRAVPDQGIVEYPQQYPD